MEPQIIAAGIKCDNKQCGFHDPSVQSVDYHKYVDTGCPSCGENLLTKKDYEAYKMLEKIANHWLVRLINKIFGFFGFKPKVHEVGMNGSGKVTLKPKEKDD